MTDPGGVLVGLVAAAASGALVGLSIGVVVCG